MQTVQHTATHCNTLQHTATHCNTDPPLHLQYLPIQKETHVHTATHCNTLQHTAKHHITDPPLHFQYLLTQKETHICTLQRTLQHAATRCNIDFPLHLRYVLIQKSTHEWAKSVVSFALVRHAQKDTHVCATSKVRAREPRVGMRHLEGLKTKSRHTYILICVQSTHVYVYAKKWDEILD